MCNINVVFKKKGKNYPNMTSFLMAVSSNSYAGNSDGDGIYCNNKLTKGLNKVDLLPLEDDINKSNTIITHQRKSTSGFNEKWTQPFATKEFVLIHNGIVNDFLGKRGSDTWGFFMKFQREFSRFRGTREERIVKAIKKLLDSRGGIYYSILIHDRKTNLSYYFKNESANINFFMGKDMLYVSTIKRNEIFLNAFKEKFKELEIENYIIYKIYVNKNIIVTSIGTIDEVEVEEEEEVEDTEEDEIKEYNERQRKLYDKINQWEEY